MVSRTNCNLNANDNFVICLTSKLIKFYWRFHLDNEAPVNCSFTQWKWTYAIYWTLDLDGEVHSIWDLWVSGIHGLQEQQGFFEIGWAGRQHFLVRSITFWFYGRGGCLWCLWHSEKFVRGSLTSSVTFDVPRCIRLISQWLGCSVGPGNWRVWIVLLLMSNVGPIWRWDLRMWRPIRSCWFSLDLGDGSFIGQLDSVLMSILRHW